MLLLAYRVIVCGRLYVKTGRHSKNFGLTMRIYGVVQLSTIPESLMEN